MSSIPSTANFIANNTEAQQKIYFQAWLEFCAQLPGGSIAVDKIISAGAITPTSATNTFNVDTEGAASTDNLDIINITNLPDGSEIKIFAKNSARTVTVRHNISTTGGIKTLLAKDTVLKYGQFMSLKRYGNMWYEFGGSSNAATADYATSAGSATSANYATSAGSSSSCTGNAATASYASSAPVPIPALSAVGSYGFFASTRVATGATLAGSVLRYASVRQGDGDQYVSMIWDTVAIAGTWKCMGFSNSTGSMLTLFVRIA